MLCCPFRPLPVSVWKNIGSRALRALHLNTVSGKLTQIQGFLSNALARKGSIAMNQQRHSFFTAGVPNAVLLRSNPAQGDRVDVLQVAGIETQR